MATPAVIPDWALDGPQAAYHYARDVIKGRFPEGEYLIAQHPYWAFCYAVNVIRARWPQGESMIIQGPHYLVSEYYRSFKDSFTGPEQMIWLLQ